MLAFRNSFPGLAITAASSALLAASLQSIGIAAPHPPLPTPCVGSVPCNPALAFADTLNGKATASATISGTTETITQTASKAILNWADFNIASGYSVNFVQPSATAAVLNNIWSADPSVIAGALHANGQVYLYNQNGIVFDKGAQINVASLTASTLKLPDNLFENGILSQNNVLTPGSSGLPAVFQADTLPSGERYAGAITVNPGAVLTTTDGGRIMLLGSAVTNRGTITTPDGQTILGAGHQVFLAASSDASLRGFLIEVSAQGDTAANLGTVINQGQISAPRGNVTLAGLIVNQAGQISATTSVGQNGSIYLVAGDAPGGTSTFAPGFGSLLPTQGGPVTLAAGSVTEILPDESSTATLSQSNLANFIPSQVNVVGSTVALQGNAAIIAPGAKVSLNAAANPQQQIASPSIPPNDGGRIYLDSGSSIDVSGLKNVPVAATRNVLQVTLEGNDLQDDPLLRDGFLHGKTVTVNTAQSQGSTLFSVTPYTGNIAIGIDEVLTTAGKIQLTSDGDVIARAGSTLNVSGGSVAFQGGFGPSTTKLLGANGKVYDISNAPSNIQYVGLANSYAFIDPTWGTSNKGSAQTYYAGYTQGANAGEIDVLSPQVYLRGAMLASTVAGIYQRSAGTLPKGGTLDLGCNCKNIFGTSLDFWAPGVVLADNAQDLLGTGFNYADPAALLPAALQGTTTLSPTQLSQSGFNHLSIFSNGAVTLPKGSVLNLAGVGSLSVTSDVSIDIDGNIRAPGGAISLSTLAKNISAPDTQFHDVTLGGGAVIDVSGTWTNDSPLIAGVQPTGPTLFNGGSVALSAEGNVVVGSQSRIDVSGGAWINSGNQLTAGGAGQITLTAANSFLALAPSSEAVELGSGAALIGNSLSAGKGGSLSLTSASITVGLSASGTPGELLLTPDFFANNGFSSYSITGQSGLIIGSADLANHTPVIIAPIQETLSFSQNDLLVPTGTALSGFTRLSPLPPSARSPVSLSFATTASHNGTNDVDTGDLLLGQYASIIVDPSTTTNPARVSLTVNGFSGDLTVLGDISAPAGDITLQLGNPNKILSGSDPGYTPFQKILLGTNSALDASAYARIDTLDPLGYREGSVLAGGTISLQANKGYLVTESGSVIKVNGTSGVLDIVGPLGVTPTTVVANAGNIELNAREGMVLQGALYGLAATGPNGQPISGAGGGTLSIGLDLFDYNDTLAYNQVPTNIPYPLASRTLQLSDLPAFKLGVLQSGMAQLSEGTIAAGGFDNVTLKSSDVLAVSGNVALSSKGSLTLDAPLLLGAAGASLNLSSPYVALGNYSNQIAYFDLPQGGGAQNPNVAAILAPGCASVAACTASLSVQAQLIDLRGISAWSGFGSEQLVSSGDIRFGTALNPSNTTSFLMTAAGDSSNPQLRAGLNAGGTLALTAQQLYPTTNTDFTLTSTAPGASISIGAAPGSAATVLSAGGILTLNAPNIMQNGVLRAPIGEINLNALDTTDPLTGLATPGTVTLAANSLTSVSANGTVIPFGATVNGQQWTYSPDAGITQVIGAPPAKAITLSGSNVTVSKNATVDLSGGGELYAYEFIAGPGGSKDILNSPNTFAIVPSLGSPFAPLDAQYLSQQGAPGASNNTANPTIYLSGVPGLATGFYALLPARYALLPGAFAVQILKSNSDIAAGAAVLQPNGSYIAAARFGAAGTDVIDSRTSTVQIESGNVARTQSQYTDSFANTFFASAAAAGQAATPSLPADAGLLQLLATQSLVLAGNNNFSTASFVSGTDAGGKPIVQQGAGGVVSIQAPNLIVVDSATPTLNAAGGLQLDVGALDKLGAQSLILGASATRTTAGEVLTAGITQAVELDNTTVALQGPQIILAAQNSITLDPGAQIAVKGTLTGSPSALLLQGAGALLSVSSDAALPTVTNSALPSQMAVPTGTLSIGSGARINSAGSLLLFSTGNTVASPDAVISAPSLGLYSNRVSLGEVPTGNGAPAGLNLTSQLLATFGGLTDLTIASSSSIDFYGSINLGSSSLNSLTLNTWSLNGYAGGNSNSAPQANLLAGAVTFENSYTTAPAALYNSLATPLGTLTVSATGATGQSGQITLGAGSKSISGFGTVTLQAAGDIQTQGRGASTSVLADAGNTPVNLSPVNLSLVSAALTAASGSDQTISTSGMLTLGKAPSSAAPAATAPLGGAITLLGSSIAQNGIIDMPAGAVTLHATGGAPTDGVTLGQGSLISAAGADRNFVVTDAVAPGGQVSLLSNNGSVTLLNGATVDVSGAASADGKAAGDAGTLSISAPHGQFIFGGSTLKGSSPAGQLQGNFTLDVGSGLSNLSPLDTLLSNGGFAGALSLRTRSDSTVNLTDAVKASSYQLTADQGLIDVLGSIDTSGGNAVNTGGGAISLWGGAGLTLESGAQLLANAGPAGPVGLSGSALATHGGNITLGIAAGQIDLKPGSIIQLKGSDASSDGVLTLRAPTLTRGGNDVAIDPIGAIITGRNSTVSVIVEGVNTYALANSGGAAGTLSAGGDALIDPTDPNSAYANLSTGLGSGGVLFGDASTLVANTQAVVCRLAGCSPKGLSVQVRPGIEIVSSGDIQLANTWDLDTWNAALGAPVNLTLRAAGNLLISASLSDGFTNTAGTLPIGSSAPSPVWLWSFGGTGAAIDASLGGIGSGVTGSYRLTAGADLTSANPQAVLAQSQPSAADTVQATMVGTELAPHSGNFILAPGNLVRTGDGSIDIAAGGDVLLGYSAVGNDADGNLQVLKTQPLSSAIYTAGVPSAPADANLFVPTNPVTRGRTAFDVSYPTGGGNITIAAAGDIRSAPSGQLTADWLWRRGPVPPADGSAPPADPNRNTSWWVVFTNFVQGIGALGGGNISLTAGRDVVNVSAVIPTTGRLQGASGALSAANLLLSGGGSLSLQAGGDVQGGVLQDDWGNAFVRAGSSLTSGATVGDEISAKNQAALNLQPTQLGLPLYPVVLLGSGTVDIGARADTTLGFVGSSEQLPETIANSTATQLGRAYFYTYSPNATLNVGSTGGDVILNDNALELPIFQLNTPGVARIYDALSPARIVYPGTLNVAAYSGNINLQAPLDLFPAATGNLNLLAQQSITGVPALAGTPSLSVQMFETDPTLWANVTLPGPKPTGPDILTLPQEPLHQGDPQQIHIVANTGNIGSSTMSFPKAADVIAGGNITDLSLTGKNLNAADVTLIEAGGNITYSTPADPITNALQPNGSGINLAGPGYLEILAGGSLNLGDSNGITTLGGLNDPRLAAIGATIVAGAGFGAAAGGLRQPAEQSFFNKYLPEAAAGAGSYANALLNYMQQLDPIGNAHLSYNAARLAFLALSPAQELPFLAQVLSDELSATGLAHTLQGAPYDRGYTAINTLFPTADANMNPLKYAGDINMAFSQIKTEQGGSIDLLAPGGSVIVGVPNPPASLNLVKESGLSASAAAAQAVGQLGVLVLGQGTIQGFADQDWQVNQSRILTLEGGDIILWASNGNIDAGRGAKSASAAPPPVIQFNTSTGLYSVNPVSAISGSGIGQLLSGPGETAGLVNLIAPKGDVNAGDAGIRVAGNLNIAAVQVIGAANITVAGTSSGVPVSEAGALAGALSGANSLGDASKSAVEQLSQDLGASTNYQQLTNSLAPTFIVVKMFCLGVECEAR